MNVSASALFPDDPGRDDRWSIPTKRRYCFVAITRARKSLTLTHARSYFGCEKGSSRFLLK